MAGLPALARVSGICGRTSTVPWFGPKGAKLVGFAGPRSLGAAAFGHGRSFAFGQMSPKLNR